MNALIQVNDGQTRHAINPDHIVSIRKDADSEMVVINTDAGDDIELSPEVATDRALDELYEAVCDQWRLSQGAGTLCR